MKNKLIFLIISSFVFYSFSSQLSFIKENYGLDERYDDNRMKSITDALIDNILLNIHDNQSLNELRKLLLEKKHSTITAAQLIIIIKAHKMNDDNSLLLDRIITLINNYNLPTRNFINGTDHIIKDTSLITSEPIFNQSIQKINTRAVLHTLEQNKPTYHFSSYLQLLKKFIMAHKKELLIVLLGLATGIYKRKDILYYFNNYFLRWIMLTKSTIKSTSSKLE